jgi:hypothetical protein
MPLYSQTDTRPWHDNLNVHSDSASEICRGFLHRRTQRVSAQIEYFCRNLTCGVPFAFWGGRPQPLWA